MDASMDSTNDTSMKSANDDSLNISNTSKSSDENVDAIRNFIEQQDKEIKELSIKENPVQNESQSLRKESQDDTVMVAESVMDMILTQSEKMILATEKVEVKKDGKHEEVKPSILTITSQKGSITVEVGTKVEAQDFEGEWHPAEVQEIDLEEVEVLVRYSEGMKKTDEWISANSSRLRQYTGEKSKPPEAEIKEAPLEVTQEVKEEPPEVKEEVKPLFVEGERCLARWRDNKRFIATVNKALNNGQYQITFDDGFVWTCGISRLHKWKPSTKTEGLSIDVTQSPTVGPSTGPNSPVYGVGPSSLQSPAYHTHLFDPTRDYLSSKSERREMKRKLNIKEIFNIGQKKPKIQKEKVVKPKAPVEKKSKPAKKPVKKKPTKVQVKSEGEAKTIPDAVASIIGTVKEEQTIKAEPDEISNDESTNQLQESETSIMEVDDVKVEEIKPDQTQDLSESDPVLEEDVVLENFDQTETDGHEQVLDQIKEAISKLEHGLNEIEKAESPKVVLETPKPPAKSDVPVIKDDLLEEKVEPSEVKIEAPSPKVEIPKDKEVTPEENVETVKMKVEIPIVKLERTIDPQKLALVSPKLPPDSPKVLLQTPEPESVYEIETKPETGALLEALDIVEESEIIEAADIPMEIETEVVVVDPTERTKKVKKTKKIKVLKEKKKSKVDLVRTELEEMKRQFEEMRKHMLLKTQELENKQLTEMPESFLLPGEWCCKWVNGQPVGKVSEIEAEIKVDANNKPVLPRRSVEVADKRLPPGWSKHMVRRSVGNSAGKWDVVLVSPQNKRFHTKTDMRHYFESHPDESLKSYESALFDFGVHLKLSRRMGWIQNTPDGIAEAPAQIFPAGSETCLSPLVKKKKPLSLKSLKKKKEKRRPIKIKLQKGLHSKTYNAEIINNELAAAAHSMDFGEMMPEEPPMPCEDGYVWCGSLKVQVIDTLLRCPAEGCFKNFRNTTLLQMHIKHYHREMRKQMGATPKVLDLAYARTKPILAEQARIDSKILKVKIPKPPKREDIKTEPDLHVDVTPTTPKDENQTTPKTQDSPKLRHALNKPVKRPRVLLPVRRVEQELSVPDSLIDEFVKLEPNEGPISELPLDFETAISTHTVTKPLEKKKKGDKKQKSFAQFSKTVSEDEEWFAMNSDDVETRSSFPRSGTPDSKVMDAKMALMSSESNEEQRDPTAYTYTESERIKIVHMKREEIINCHCGFREEDGLMVQCELCLCWQHAICHNIQREAEVPEKYTCSICLNPRRGRRSKRFLHDQDRMYEGLLPGAGAACPALRRSHELSGNLLRIQDALHALRVKYYVATKKDHPKLYLWAADWEAAELPSAPERLHSDYSDLAIMINGINKENMPVGTCRGGDHLPLDITSSPSDHNDLDRFTHRESQLGSQALLSGLLSSPGGGSLDLPITTSELERLASSVQAEEAARAAAEGAPAPAPQPEAAIEGPACRERLLRHVARAQAVLDTRLDSLEAQLAELESQDPSFGEFYETAEFFPRTKQTIQMLMRDLDTMEELGVIT